jgi:hypothetical protein
MSPTDSGGGGELTIAFSAKRSRDHATSGALLRRQSDRRLEGYGRREHSSATTRVEFSYLPAQCDWILAPLSDAFSHYWTRENITGLWDGWLYDDELCISSPTVCGPHGEVVRPWDLESFLGS